MNQTGIDHGQRVSGYIGPQPGKTYVYLLTDPNTKQPRYVGKARNPRSRYKNHLSNARTRRRNTHSAKWIGKLLDNGQCPQMICVDLVPGDGNEIEKEFIATAKRVGYRLTNHTEGGGGNSGIRRTPESKAKVAASLKAFYGQQRDQYGTVQLTAVQREARCAKRPETPKTPEQIARVAQRQAQKALNSSPEAKRLRRQQKRNQKRNRIVPLTINQRCAMIPLDQGKWAMIDTEDWGEASQYTWSYLDGKARAHVVTDNRKIVYLGAVVGRTCNRKQCGNVLDYRRSGCL